MAGHPGFAVGGADHFLASGHPDMCEDLPTRLGLIESTDGAETWNALAMQGEVPRPMEMALGSSDLRGWCRRPWLWPGRADEHFHTLEVLEVLPTRLTTEDSIIRGYARILHGTWKEALERASDLRFLWWAILGLNQ